MYLINSDCLVGTDEELARACRCECQEIVKAISELKRFNVADIEMQNGCTIMRCRRISRQLKISRLRAESASKRWSKPDANGLQDVHAKGGAPSASASASAYASKGNGVQGKGVRLYPREIKMQMEAKERQASELKNRHCNEVALGEHWDDRGARQRYREIRSEIKTLNGQLADYQKEL